MDSLNSNGVDSVCVRCHSRPPTDGFKTCGHCRAEMKEYKRTHKEGEKERHKNYNIKTQHGKWLAGIHEKYSHEEIKALSKGKGLGTFSVNPLKVTRTITEDEIRFGFFTDPHMGSIYYHEEFLDDFILTCEEREAQFVVCGGDLTHGMDARKYNLLYELKHIGYAAQKDYAVQQLSKIPFHTYLVSGNHDRWYESVGANIVKDVCDMVPKMEYIGRDEGDIGIGEITLRVFHGEDGSSYALSYRAQKLIESFTGGEKPNVLLMGHSHKQGYFFDRHIHAVSGGAMSTQSKWMRSKRMANHAGYHFITIRVDEEGGVGDFTLTWRPFYV
jgi:predicted phosphodiesterase